MGSLWSYYQTPNPLNGHPPHFWSTVPYFGVFLNLFLPTAWAKPKISQHLLAKILESATYTLRGRQWVREHIIARENVIFVFLPLKKCQKTCVFILLPILQTIYKAWRAGFCIVQPIFAAYFYKLYDFLHTTGNFHFQKSVRILKKWWLDFNVKL